MLHVAVIAVLAWLVALCYGAMCGWRDAHRRAQAALARERNLRLREQALRIDYERALGLPFYSRADTEKALLARASHNDPVAEQLVLFQVQRELDSLAGVPHLPATTASD